MSISASISAAESWKRMCIAPTRWPIVSGPSRSSRRIVSPGPRIAEQKPIDEMWPSPIWRRLIATRSSPGSRSAWSGCGTIDGLHSAAASTENSWLKYAPIRVRAVGDSSISGGTRCCTSS